MSEGGGAKVQYFELFFDLVYVFTLIQITRTMVEAGTLNGIIHGLVVLVLVWWVWVAFTSMANVGMPSQYSRDWRQPLFAVAMALLLLVALSIPQAFWDNSKLFAFSYLALAALALGGQYAVARFDPPMRQATLRLIPFAAMLPIALVITSFISSEIVSVVVIVIGIACAAAAPVLSGSREWKISTGHLAERYSLFMLITMGETIISLGEGATKAPMTPLLVAAVLISFILIVILLRHYYTEVLDAGERRLHEISGASLVRFARYGYTYLHLAMVAGLLLAAVALKAAMKDLTTPLDDILEACLAAGVGLFLLATMLFSALAKEPWRRLSLLAVVVLAILTVVGPRIPTISLIILVVIAAAIGVDPRSLGGRIPRYLSRDA